MSRTLRPVAGMLFALVLLASASAGHAQGILRSEFILSSNPGSFFTGSTEIVPAGAVLGQGERFAVVDFVSNGIGDHEIHMFDENLTQVGTISVTLAGPHAMGIAWDEASQTFWVSDFLAFPTPAFFEFDIAGIATGNSIAFCDSHPSGGATIDTSFGRRILYALDTGADIVRAWDMDADVELTEWSFGGCGGSCSQIETPDGAGSESFGLDTAANPSRCGGGNLVIASGVASITSLTQFGYDDDPLSCPDEVNSCFNCDMTILATAGEFVPQGVVEFQSTFGTGRDLFVVGAGTAKVYILDCDAGIGDCQNVDADADVLFVNTSQGGPDFTLQVDNTQPLAASIQKPAGQGNGKYVVHLDVGFADSSTITSVLDLGDACFPFVGGTSVAVWNNAGKEPLVGSSTFFGSSIPNPSKADAFFWLMPSGDATNLPVGSRLTLQGAIINPASSSTRSASLTNAIQLEVE